MNTQSEFEFLKDQVVRLNGVLSYYHENLMEKLEKSGSNTLRTVLNNQTAPLLAEYDRIILELRGQLRDNKSLVMQDETRVTAVIKENERLWKQLNDQNRVSEVTENLNRQVQSLTTENTSLEQLLRVCDEEVDRLQSLTTEHNMKPQTVIFNERMEEIKKRYQGSILELEHEVSELRELKRELTNELEKMDKRCSEMERDNVVIVEKLRFEKEASEENSNLLKSSLKRIEYMDKEKKQLAANLEEVKCTLRGHDSAKSEWSSVLENIESRYHEKEQQNYESSLKLKEAFQMVEDAMTEKKATEIREMQATNECDRLRGVIGGILEDAGIRTREEVDIVREKCEKEVDRVVEELNLCEQNRQELLAEIEQIKRNKTQLEQEMEMYHRAERERSLQDLSSAEVSHERMIRAERELETLRLQCNSSANNIEKEKVEKQRLRESHDSEIAELQKKIALLQASSDKAQTNADHFAKLFNNSEECAGHSRKKYQESLKKSRHDYEILKQKFQIKQLELETRLASTEETQRHSASEMRQILHKQQQLSSKWKEEAHSLSNQYEERLNQVNKELERLKLRNTDMVSLLQESKQQILESQEEIEDKKRTIDILDSRLRILDEDGGEAVVPDKVDSTCSSDASWQLKQIKKQQQRLIRDSVARAAKAKLMLECS